MTDALWWERPRTSLAENGEQQPHPIPIWRCVYCDEPFETQAARNFHERLICEVEHGD